MIKNYIITTLRTIKRNKLYTAINVAGLGLGISCTILIFALIKYHLSFDDFHPEADRIFRVTTELDLDQHKYIEGVPAPLPEAFRNDYAFAEESAVVYKAPNELISIDGTASKFEEEIAFAEPSFFRVFGFEMIRGDAKVALARPDAVILTENMARKFFGTNDPVGKTLKVAGKAEFRVMGVLKDLPLNTDRRSEIYLPFMALKALQPWNVSENWRNVNNDMQFFIRLKRGVSAASLEGVLAGFAHKYYSDQDAKEWSFHLQGLQDVHLNKLFGAAVSRDNLLALGCIGMFLLLAACINFVNLATAQAISRSKEIGVRKVLGSSPGHLFWQFIVETAVISLLAAVLAIVLAEMTLPLVNQLFNAQIPLEVLTDPYLAGFLVVILLFVVFASGCYPGMVLAGIQPVLALKGKISHGSTGSVSLRKGLVVVQFAISQLLIIGTIVIVNQMRYAQNADMGFAKNGIVVLPVPDNKPAKIRTLQAQFAKIPGVENSSFCYAPPAYQEAGGSRIQFGSRPQEEKFTISCRYADEHYASVFDLKLLAGRNLAKSDTVREFVLNLATVKALGFAKPDQVLNKKVVVNGYSGTVVGVMKDFHNKSLHAAIEPLALTSFFVWYERCAVKIDTRNIARTLAALKNTWQRAYPDAFYKQEFLDERIFRMYDTDRTMMKLLEGFTFIAVFIGCLSLYGLVSFMAARRRKEVAVRKVLGATVGQILTLFFAEFGKLMFIAFVIAAPAAWFAMHDWLTNFAYRTDLGAWVFIFALGITSAVVTCTVLFKSLKTAMADPSVSLRSE